MEVSGYNLAEVEQIKNHRMDFLDVLNRVEKPEERMKQILEFEMNFDLLLPPILKLFFQLYEGGNYAEKMTFEYLLESSKHKRSFCTIIPATNTNFLIYEFMPLHEIRSNMEKVYPIDHMIWNEKLIPIAETSGQGYILISLQKETRDEVYIDFPGEDEIKFLANNIFELLMKIKVEFLDKKIIDGKIENLYKRWGEKYWRLSKL